MKIKFKKNFKENIFLWKQKIFEGKNKKNL